jgi:hypothetical protein
VAADKALAVGGARDVLMGADQSEVAAACGLDGPSRRGMPSHRHPLEERDVGRRNPAEPDRTPQSASMHGLGDVGP